MLTEYEKMTNVQIDDAVGEITGVPGRYCEANSRVWALIYDNRINLQWHPSGYRCFASHADIDGETSSTNPWRSAMIIFLELNRG